MHSTELGLPPSVYEEMQLSERLSSAAQNVILSALKQNGFSQLALYGKSRTAEAFRQALGKSVMMELDSAALSSEPNLLSGADAILLATSPVHYTTILEFLESAGVTLPVIAPFAGGTLPVRLVVETQPRSGTHYILDNILRVTNLGYASVFAEKGLVTAPDGMLRYQTSHKEEYVVKAHFIKPLHYPAYRFCKTVFVISYFFDSYYSWGKLLALDNGPDYRLESSSPEWQLLKGYISLHQQWLNFIRDKYVLRYEDFYRDFEKTVTLLGEYAALDLKGFTPPRLNPRRSYWSARYQELFDNSVFQYLNHEFAPWISHFYPEIASERLWK